MVGPPFLKVMLHQESILTQLVSESINLYNAKGLMKKQKD